MVNWKTGGSCFLWEAEAQAVKGPRGAQRQRELGAGSPVLQGRPLQELLLVSGSLPLHLSFFAASLLGSLHHCWAAEAAILSQETCPGALGDLEGRNSDCLCIYLIPWECTLQSLAQNQGELRAGVFGSVSHYSWSRIQTGNVLFPGQPSQAGVSASIHCPSPDLLPATLTLCPGPESLNWTCSCYTPIAG